MTSAMFFTPLRRSLKVARRVVATFAIAFTGASITLYVLAFLHPDPVATVPLIATGATGLLVSAAAMWVVLLLINHSIAWAKKESELQLQAVLKSAKRRDR